MDATDLNAVRVFVAIVDAKGIRGAAHDLGLPRSTVSRKLAALEARLGLTILNRTTRTVSLTDAGQAYYARAVQALGALDDAERVLREARGRPTGTLRVTASHTMAQQGGGDLLVNFLTANPDVRVVLDLSEGTHGNACGIGLADLITERCYQAIDRRVTYTNIMTSGSLEAGKFPIALPDEDTVIRAALSCMPGIDPATATVVRIRDTLHLQDIAVSENLLPFVRQHPAMKVLGAFASLPH